MPMHTSLRDGAEKNIEYGEIAQLAKHMVHTHGVEGSTPPLATNKKL